MFVFFSSQLFAATVLFCHILFAETLCYLFIWYHMIWITWNWNIWYPLVIIPYAYAKLTNPQYKHGMFYVQIQYISLTNIIYKLKVVTCVNNILYLNFVCFPLTPSCPAAASSWTWTTSLRHRCYWLVLCLRSCLVSCNNHVFFK